MNKKTVSLTVDQLPSHSHTTTGGWGAGSMGNAYFRADQNNPATRWNPTGSTGGNQPHENMPPFQALYMWIRSA